MDVLRKFRLTVPQRCKFPNCGGVATRTFALVPLCEHHGEAIWKETRRWYARRKKGWDLPTRDLYHEIEELIPWSEYCLTEKKIRQKRELARKRR